MLMIRLQRLGKKKQPTYRFVVSEKAKDTQAGSLEILGHYAPTQNPKLLELKADRIAYWMKLGAQPSATVHNILLAQGLIKGKKERSVYLSQKRQKKIAAKKAAEAPKAEAAA